MKMTKTEERLFREKVIREFKIQQEKYLAKTRKPSALENFAKRMRKLAPVNIIVGVIAAVMIIIIKDWQTLAYLLLYGIVWLTLITTIVSALFDK